MAQKRYEVTLTEDEETALHAIINKGKCGAQKRKRVQVPLLASEGHTDEAAAERADMRFFFGEGGEIEDLRKRLVENGFESSLEGKPRGHRPRVLSGEYEARLIALVCGPAPEGYARRALRLLEDRRVTLEGTDGKTVFRETIRRTLKKAQLLLGRTGNGVSFFHPHISLPPPQKKSNPKKIQPIHPKKQKTQRKRTGSL
jgi:hypothetical protein